MLESTRLKICQQAIEHWMYNLLLCHAGDYSHVDYHAESCPLCENFNDIGCTTCPMAQIKNCCNADGSPWDGVVDAFFWENRCDRIRACERMLRAVEKACAHLMNRGY